jgi:hypothetical protein
VVKKISNSSNPQLIAILVVVVCIAALRHHPYTAAGFCAAAAGAHFAVQQLGKEYDKPLRSWWFLLALSASAALTWFV